MTNGVLTGNTNQATQEGSIHVHYINCSLSWLFYQEAANQTRASPRQPMSSHGHKWKSPQDFLPSPLAAEWVGRRNFSLTCPWYWRAGRPLTFSGLSPMSPGYNQSCGAPGTFLPNSRQREEVSRRQFLHNETPGLSLEYGRTWCLA